MNGRALPYGLHSVDEDDVEAVRTVLLAEAARDKLLDADDIEAALSVLRGPLLTQGPEVARFESSFAEAVGAKFAVACSSGTAALHLALLALDVGPGDICVVPAITFLSTATAARFCGAEVLFADVDPQTGLMTPKSFQDAIAKANGPVKVVLPVHLGGRMCDVQGIAEVANSNGIKVVEDGCHALGTSRGNLGKVGESRFSQASVFSFHPVKTIACGEGGMITTNDQAIKDRLGRLRNHGVTRDPLLMQNEGLSFDANGEPNPWSYEQLELGYNYRMNEVEAALGTSQLNKLSGFVSKRLQLVEAYRKNLSTIANYIECIYAPGDQDVSFHIFSVKLKDRRLVSSRAELMKRLIAKGVGCQVHYIPVYRQPYFEGLYGKTSLPCAEEYYESTLTLPMYPGMSLEDANWVSLEVVSVISKLLEDLRSR